MLESKINTNYPNYDSLIYYTSYEYDINKDYIEVLDELLKDLDCTKLYKGKQIISTNSIAYKDKIDRFIRISFRIPIKEYIIYNNYINKLLNVHNNNIEFEEELNKEIINIPNKTKRKKKVANQYVRMETHNLFTGELEYDYTNFATGHTIYSKNPNLLEELNAPKKKNKPKKLPKEHFGKIIFKFPMK